MSIIPSEAPRRLTARAIRDVAAVILLVLGLVGLAVVAFAKDDLLGWATVSAEAAVVGLLLGFDGL